MRLREVEIHHADLGLGYTAADWPTDFVVLLLDSRADAATTARRFTARATDLDRTWVSSAARRADGVRSPAALWHGGRRAAGTRADGT